MPTPLAVLTREVYRRELGLLMAALYRVGRTPKASQTIPKHGGETCRVDLKPLQIRRGKTD